MIIKPNYIMDHPLLENRIDSLNDVDITKRYIQIINILGDKSMTAKEIAVEMYRKEYSYTDDRNLTSPRLNELMNLNVVTVLGKSKCKWSGKMVGVYKINPDVDIKERLKI